MVRLTCAVDRDAVLVLLVVDGALLLVEMAHGAVVTRAEVARMSIRWELLRVAALAGAGLTRGTRACYICGAASLEMLTGTGAA